MSVNTEFKNHCQGYLPQLCDLAKKLQSAVSWQSLNTWITLAGKIKSCLIPFPFTCELIVVFLHLKADVKLSLWCSTADRLQLCVTTPNAYLWLNEDQLWQITFWWLCFDLEPENRMAIYSFIWHTFIGFLPGPLHKVFSDLTNTTETLQTW